MPPAPPQSFIPLAVAAKNHRRRVMEKAAEGVAAKDLVVLGVENELMPEIIHDLAGHRNKCPAAFQVCEEKLA